MRGRSERWVDLYNAKEVSVKEYVRRTSYPQLSVFKARGKRQPRSCQLTILRLVATVSDVRKRKARCSKGIRNARRPSLVVLPQARLNYSTT